MNSPKPPDHHVPVHDLMGEDRKTLSPKRTSSKPWWPEAFGTSPDASGSQERVQFAYFANALRLLVKRGEEVATYNTRGLSVRGVRFCDAGDVVIDTEQGTVRPAELHKL